MNSTLQITNLGGPVSIAFLNSAGDNYVETAKMKTLHWLTESFNHLICCYGIYPIETTVTDQLLSYRCERADHKDCRTFWWGHQSKWTFALSRDLPGGMRSPVTRMGRDLPYPVGKAPKIWQVSLPSVAHATISAWRNFGCIGINLQVLV